MKLNIVLLLSPLVFALYGLLNFNINRFGQETGNWREDYLQFDAFFDAFLWGYPIVIAAIAFRTIRYRRQRTKQSPKIFE